MYARLLFMFQINDIIIPDLLGPPLCIRLKTVYFVIM